MVDAAFPFVTVDIDTAGLAPVAERAPGVIAVVGAGGGAAPANTPLVVDSPATAVSLFGSGTALSKSLTLALTQTPQPSKIYGVKISSGDYALGLGALDAVDDVTFVSLAGLPATAGNLTALGQLKTHCEINSAAGLKRIGVAMIDPTVAKSPTYVGDVSAAVDALKSDTSRMIMMAARGAVDDSGGTADVATAAMAAMAGYPPHISMVLKKVVGFVLPAASGYSPAEIKGLSEANINPIIDPALIVGESKHFADGRCFTSDANLLFIDIVRTLDDIDFRLKAGLIGQIGDARITKAGLIRVQTRIEGILGPLKRAAVIDDFAIDIPLLAILSIPESARTATENTLVATARANRQVPAIVTVTYGPAVHQLQVTLRPKF